MQFAFLQLAVIGVRPTVRQPVHVKVEDAQPVLSPVGRPVQPRAFHSGPVQRDQRGQGFVRSPFRVSIAGGKVSGLAVGLNVEHFDRRILRIRHPGHPDVHRYFGLLLYLAFPIAHKILRLRHTGRDLLRIDGRAGHRMQFGSLRRRVTRHALEKTGFMQYVAAQHRFPVPHRHLSLGFRIPGVFGDAPRHPVAANGSAVLFERDDETDLIPPGIQGIRAVGDNNQPVTVRLVQFPLRAKRRCRQNAEQQRQILCHFHEFVALWLFGSLNSIVW